MNTGAWLFFYFSNRKSKLICFAGILRLFTKTSAWQKGKVWRSWRDAKNLASTGSTRWSEASNQPHSNLNILHSPSGPSPMKQPCGRRCQSTPGLPWWQSSEEPSACFLDFSSQPVWLFWVASRSCYPFSGPNIMDHGNTNLRHSMHIASLIFIFYRAYCCVKQPGVFCHSLHPSTIYSCQYLLMQCIACGIFCQYTQVYSEQDTGSGKWSDGTIESSPVRTFNVNDCFGKNWYSCFPFQPLRIVQI